MLNFVYGLVIGVVLGSTVIHLLAKSAVESAREEALTLRLHIQEAFLRGKAVAEADFKALADKL